MAEIGFPGLIKRLEAVIGLLVVTPPQPDQSRSLREQNKTTGRGRSRARACKNSRGEEKRR
jgi:hypothetical protein